MTTLLFTLASLLVVFYVIHLKSLQVEPIVIPPVRVERKVTPITSEQRARLSVLASYALASRRN